MTTRGTPQGPSSPLHGGTRLLGPFCRASNRGWVQDVVLVQRGQVHAPRAAARTHCGPFAELLCDLRFEGRRLGPADVWWSEREQRGLVEHLPRARCATLRSPPHGHDAFLIEFPQVAAQLRRFLNEVG